MKRSLLAVFGAAVIASLGANWGARAAVIDFGAAVAGGAVTYVGSSLDQSTLLDLDEATLLVTEIAAGDASGLALFDTIMLSAATVPVSSQIIYGSGTGPGPLGADVILSWPIGGSGSDAFTETLTTVVSINRSAANEIVITLSGTVSDTDGVFIGFSSHTHPQRHPGRRTGAEHRRLVQQHLPGGARRSRSIDLGDDGARLRRSWLRGRTAAQGQDCHAPRVIGPACAAGIAKAAVCAAFLFLPAGSDDLDPRGDLTPGASPPAATTQGPGFDHAWIVLDLPRVGRRRDPDLAVRPAGADVPRGRSEPDWALIFGAAPLPAPVGRPQPGRANSSARTAHRASLAGQVSTPSAPLRQPPPARLQQTDLITSFVDAFIRMKPPRGLRFSLRDNSRPLLAGLRPEPFPG